VPELDNGTLPLGRQGLAQHVISGFPKLFLDFGVPLWEKAKVEVVKKGEEWIVTEAIGEKWWNAVCRTRYSWNPEWTKYNQNMLVYTPAISPGWSDSETGHFKDA